MNQGDLKRISPYLYEIPKTHRHDMRVPARFYADAELLQAALGDKSLDQLVNSATLPGIVGYALAMPDIHQGYGFPIGGVVATQAQGPVGRVLDDANIAFRFIHHFIIITAFSIPEAESYREYHSGRAAWPRSDTKERRRPPGIRACPHPSRTDDGIDRRCPDPPR